MIGQLETPRLMTISPAELVVFALCAIVAITFHEAAHGYVAFHFGDDTAKKAGRVTLNPFKHIDLFGTVILPAILFWAAGFLFGYAKPVPVTYGQLRNPRWDMVWVAAAGPGMNVALALISTLLLSGIGLIEGENAAVAGNALLLSIKLNLILAIFNILPLPPLDGSKVIAAFLPEAAVRPYLSFGRFGMTILLLILLVGPFLIHFDILGWLVLRPADWTMQALLRLTGRG